MTIKDHLYTTLYMVFLFKVNITRGVGYIYYDKIGLHCIPVNRCEPGYTIKPCNTSFSHDECVQCPSGQKQPNIIYAMHYRTQEGQKTMYKPNDISCFKPISHCLDNELLYQRHTKMGFCEELFGCKCNPSKCYYGDPCLCTEKKDVCGVNKTLNDDGECEPCEECFEKRNDGCGPCVPTKGCIVQQYRTSTTKDLKVLTYAPPYLDTDRSKPEKTTSGKWTTSVNSEILDTTKTEPKQHKQISSIIIIVIVMSAVVMVLLILTVVIMIRRKKSCTISQVLGIVVCGSETQINRNVLLDKQGTEPSIKDGRKRHSSLTENGRITTSPTDSGDCSLTADVLSSHRSSEQYSANYGNQDKQSNKNECSNYKIDASFKQNSEMDDDSVKASLLENLQKNEIPSSIMTHDHVPLSDRCTRSAFDIKEKADTNFSSGCYLSMK